MSLLFGCERFVIIGLLISTTTYGQDLMKRRTSNVCKTHADCPTNATCEHNNEPTEFGQCVCDEFHISISVNKTRACYKVAQNLGDSCIFDDQCKFTFSTDAECRDGRCECQPDTHFVAAESACYRSAKIGDFCRLSHNCIGEQTLCQSGICNCPFETHPNTQRDDCIQDIKLGDLCSDDEECIATNSRCHGVCRCAVGYILSANSSKCLPVPEKLSDECEETSQCQVNIPNSVCAQDTFNPIFNRTCVCRRGYREVNYRCWVSVELGGICSETENCQTPNAECIEGRCMCQDGFFAIDEGFHCSKSTRLSLSISFISVISLLWLGS